MTHLSKTVLQVGRVLITLVATALLATVAIAAVILIRMDSQSMDDLGMGAAPTPASPAPETDPPVSSPALIAPSTLEVKQVGAALEAGQADWTEEFGASCFVQADLLVYYPPDLGKRLDVEIADANVGDEAWLSVDETWVGSAARAAEAFGATRLYEDDHERWMLLTLDGSVALAELEGTETPAGRTVWMILNTVTACR